MMYIQWFAYKWNTDLDLNGILAKRNHSQGCPFLPCCGLFEEKKKIPGKPKRESYYDKVLCICK
jgi:hypothetical protein